MAGEEEVGIKVDMNRVVEKLKARWLAKLAELEHENAMLEVALEDAVRGREEAEEENRLLRAGNVKPPE